MGDDVLSHSVGEEFVLRIGTKVDKWQDSDGWLRSQIVRLNFIDAFDESISTPRQSLDITRSVCRIPKSCANPRNRIVQAVVEIDESVGRPDLRPKFFSRHQIPGTLQESSQYLQRLALQAQFRSSFAQLTSADVQFENVKPQHLRDFRRGGH